MKTKIWTVEGEMDIMLGICTQFNISFPELMKLPIPTYWFLRYEYFIYCEEVEKQRQKNKQKTKAK